MSFLSNPASLAIASKIQRLPSEQVNVTFQWAAPRLSPHLSKHDKYQIVPARAAIPYPLASQTHGWLSIR